MAEYIERYAAIAALLAKLDERKHAEFLFGDEIDTIIRNIRAADVVEVVRCKYCVYCTENAFAESDEAYCSEHDCCVSETYFCADGRRRKQNERN